MSTDVRRGRLNTDPPAPVATGQTVRLVPQGETAGFHGMVSPRLEEQRVNRCRGDTRGVIARGIIAECGTECLIRGRVALLWSLRKSSGFCLFRRREIVKRGSLNKKRDAAHIDFRLVG